MSDLSIGMKNMKNVFIIFGIIVLFLYIYLYHRLAYNHDGFNFNVRDLSIFRNIKPVVNSIIFFSMLLLCLVCHYLQREIKTIAIATLKEIVKI